MVPDDADDYAPRCRILPPIPTTRPLIAGAAACALLAVAGCGGNAADEPTGSVRLTVATPRDFGSVTSSTVRIGGSVKPSTATVTVRGKRAATASTGVWTATVALEPGVNVVDVLASGGRDRPALTAIRVRRVVEIKVPDVTGLSADDAQSAIEDAHLTAKLQTEGGGLLDDLFGGDPTVCSTDPEAGTEVEPGSTVTATLARRC